MASLFEMKPSSKNSALFHFDKIKLHVEVGFLDPIVQLDLIEVEE